MSFFLSFSAKVARLAEVLVQEQARRVGPGLVPWVEPGLVAEMAQAPAAVLGLGLVPRAAQESAEVLESEQVEAPVLEQAPGVEPGLVAEMGLAPAASWVRVLVEVLVLEQAPGVGLAPAALAMWGRCS